MKKINVIKKRGSFGEQIFDKLYAYSQSLSPDWKSNLEIIFSNDVIDGYKNILFYYMPSEVDNLDKYDLIIFDNSDEPLGTAATEFMIEQLQHDRVYCQIGSCFHKDKNIPHDKIIPMVGDAENFYRYVNTPFYPQYYQNFQFTESKKNVIFINGLNRAHRHHIQTLIQDSTDIECKNSMTAKGKIHETNDSLIESESDTKFREYCNTFYPIERNLPSHHFTSVIQVGINDVMGEFNIGYMLIPEFYQYRVIAYPETSWINDELILTEKSLKCFYAGTLPLIIGGRNINKLANQMGFYTAYNILPEDMTQFDCVEDHFQRYEMIVNVLAWIDENIDAVDQEYYNKLVNHNFNHFMSNKCAQPGVEKLYKVIDAL